MVLEQPLTPLLSRVTLPEPRPGPGQIRIDVAACGVCRTDLHIVDGELTHPRLPLVLGHEIAGNVAAPGRASRGLPLGDASAFRGSGWTCGTCSTAGPGRENLVRRARSRATPRRRLRGSVADQRYGFPLPDGYSRCRGRATVVRRADRYRSLRACGRSAARDLRLRRGRAPRRADRPLSQVVRSTRSRGPATRSPGVRARPRRGVGRRFRRGATRRARRGDHLRTRRGARAAPARGRAQRWRRGLRRHPHERHPGFPYEILWGNVSVRSVANLTRAQWGRIPRHGTETLGQDEREPHAAIRRQRGARTVAQGRADRRRSADPLV